MAQSWQELAVARDFLTELRSIDADSSKEIDGRSVEEWIACTEEWLQRAERAVNGVKGVFEQVAEITDRAYRD